MTKRRLSVSIKMSEDDLALLTKAANHVWPKALLSRSSIVLGLARRFSLVTLIRAVTSVP
jgi:hypothetical protein